MNLRIGMLMPSASRRAGGLFSAVSSLSTELSRSNCALQVFAAQDADIEADREAWNGATLSLRPTRGPKAFAYQPGLIRDLAAAQLDIVHLHGLWTYASVASMVWSEDKRPRVISPHGMLDDWALRNSALKKSIVSAIFEKRNVMRADVLHALCEPERQAIRAYGYRGPVATIANGVFLDPSFSTNVRPTWASALSPGSKVLLFLGRIHHKKGLDRLIHAMSLWPGAEAWHLVIAGWDQAGTQAALAAQAQALGLAERVHFIGPQFGEQKTATLAVADAFVLPSLSEGLPMAVLEAWAAGLPVLMTDACNLTKGFQSGAAIRLALEPTAMLEGLAELDSFSQSALAAVGANGRALVEAQFSWDYIADQMRQLYDWMLGGGEPPAFVETD